MNPRKIKQICKAFQEEINKTVTDFCDCYICGLCCKDEYLSINEMDANRISRKLGIKKETFLNQYTHYETEVFDTVMNMPCAFLKDNRCSIYPDRPDVCRNYPIIVMEEGIVIINEIDACALATHFNEAFLNFLEKYYPDCYKQAIETPEIEGLRKKSDREEIRNAVYDIPHISYFIDWLNSIK